MSAVALASWCSKAERMRSSADEAIPRPWPGHRTATTLGRAGGVDPRWCAGRPDTAVPRPRAAAECHLANGAEHGAAGAEARAA